MQWVQAFLSRVYSLTKKSESVGNFGLIANAQRVIGSSLTLSRIFRILLHFCSLICFALSLPFVILRLPFA